MCLYVQNKLKYYPFKLCRGKRVVHCNGVNVKLEPSEPSCQCDQMVTLIFNIWPFVTMKILARLYNKFAKVG